MALYVPAGRRRRRVIIVGVVALVAGILLGLLVSRLATPSVDEQVRIKQRDVEQLVARLDGLSLEYEQSGASGASGADAREGTLEAARGIASDTEALMADLPWLSDAQRQAVVQAVGGVNETVDAAAPVDEVKRAVVTAEAALRTAAGLAAPAS
jgi:hypothetical protein